MNDFNINGFLGSEAELISANNYNQYDNLFHFCEELNRYTIALVPQINIHNHDARELIIGGLFLKILNGTQSAVILMKYGLDIEANTIIRTALESLYWLVAIIKHKSFYTKFIDTNGKTKNDFAERIRKYPKRYHPDVVESYKDYQPSQTINTDFSPLRVETVAYSAELKESFDNAYSILCLSSHPDLKNIEDRYFVIENSEIVALDSLPSTRDIKVILSTNCFIIIEMLKNIDKFFKLNISKDLIKFEEQNAKLFYKK